MQPLARTMIQFTGENWGFNFRTAAVVFDPSGKRVLLHRAVTDDFWTMPGGRVEVGESAADAVRREMTEELGVEVEVERLLWVVEGFFTYVRRWHEIGFYFLVTLPAGSPLYDAQEPFYGDEDGIQLIYTWFSLDELDRTNLLPPFLKTALLDIPDGTRHLVCVED